MSNPVFVFVEKLLDIFCGLRENIHGRYAPDLRNGVLHFDQVRRLVRLPPENLWWQVRCVGFQDKVLQRQLSRQPDRSNGLVPGDRSGNGNQEAKAYEFPRHLN